MKKIIATVLAMVMALALCATAFAANPVYTKAYDEKGKEITNKQVYEVQTDAAVKPVSPAENGSVKGYTVAYADKAENVNIAAGLKYVAATAADYDLKLTADGRADLYLKKAPNGSLSYSFKVTAFTAIGEKCEQLDVDATGTYYSHTVSGVTTYYEASETGMSVLFNNELITVKPTTVKTLNAHDWKAASYNKDNTVATYKCADCGTVATVYKTADAAKAAGAGTVDTFAGYVIGYTYTAGTTAATTTTTSSPKTFDAGIAMYVGMALTSVAGSAVVIGKKKEF